MAKHTDDQLVSIFIANNIKTNFNSTWYAAIAFLTLAIMKLEDDTWANCYSRSVSIYKEIVNG